MDTVSLLLVAVGVVSLVLGVVIGVTFGADKATKGTSDLLLAALYLYADDQFGSEWRAEFIEGVGSYMIEHEPMVKAMAHVLAAGRRDGVVPK